jgi:hypothetical protein
MKFLGIYLLISCANLVLSTRVSENGKCGTVNRRSYTCLRSSKFGPWLFIENCQVDLQYRLWKLLFAVWILVRCAGVFLILYDADHDLVEVLMHTVEKHASQLMATATTSRLATPSLPALPNAQHLRKFCLHLLLRYEPLRLKRPLFRHLLRLPP